MIDPPSHEGGAAPPTTVATPAQSEPAPQPQTTISDLDSFLSEFDAATKAPDKPAAPAETSSAAPAEIEVQARAKALSDAQAAYDKAIKDNADALTVLSLRSQVNSLQGMVQAVVAHHTWENDNRYFDNMVKSANEKLAKDGIPVSDDYVKRWLLSEAQLNPDLAAAFDNRNRDPQAARAYTRLEAKALEKLAATARKEPDPAATADRWAVTAAMRGTSTRVPEPPPIRYGDLTDAQFAAEKKRLGVG